MTGKKKNSAPFARPNYEDMTFDEYQDYIPSYKNEESYDDVDDSWPQEEEKEENMWEATEPEDVVPSAPPLPKGVNACMSAALWFNDISKKGSLSNEEARYMGLIVMEMSKFYFNADQLKKLPPKELDAVKEIYRKIGESGIC